MLDRTKVITELSKTINKSCNLIIKEKEIARNLWKEIGEKENFYEEIKDKGIPIPSWDEKIVNKTKIVTLENYDVLAIDGSQIYPDRHLGINYFLINIGEVFLSYGPEKSLAKLDSTPIINLGCDPSSFEGTEMVINARRTEFELKTGLDLIKKTTTKNSLFLFDGSIIFWHLQAQETKNKDNFLKSYLEILNGFYEKKCLYAGYISLPNSRELINILRATAQLKKIDENFQHLIDSDVIEFYLESNERSILFKNNSHISSFYPAHSHPYFFYFKTDYEIIRIEIPAWIAHDKEKIKIVESIIFDQINKGQGYPVALAEAHNQAVITNFDRTFFNHLLHLTLLEYPYPKPSQKSIKKQRLSI